MFTDELRIGNWVQRIGFPLKVTGIKGSDVWVDGNGVELEYYIYDGINPIPLTEEWLIRFGFKYDEDDNWYVLDSIIAVSFNSIFNGLTHYFGNLECVWADVSQEIKYVHQLQNLYFALTGEEL